MPSRVSDAETLRRLEEWMNDLEGERLEFKEAKNRYDFTELTRYLCALANEGGGRLLLGVSDKRPRTVVGSESFPQLESLRSNLLEKLPLRIDVQEVHHPAGRVVVIEIASRPVGTPVQVDERFWCRRGDRLETLSAQRLRDIFAETGHDFSADILSVGDQGRSRPSRDRRVPASVDREVGQPRTHHGFA